MRCDLCGWEMEGGTRTCGAELCEVCYGGEIAKRVEPLGLMLETKLKSSRLRKHSTVTSVSRTVRGHVILAQPAPEATFSREGMGTKLRKFLGFGPDELQLGDALFDDTVLIDTSTPEITRTALSNDRLQSVVLEAVSEFGLVQFEAIPDGGRVTVSSFTSGDPRELPKEGHQRMVALALLYLRETLGAP